MRTPLTFLSIGDTNTPDNSSANTLVAEGGETQTIANGTTQSQRRLLVRDEVISLLQITAEKVQQLINNRTVVHLMTEMLAPQPGESVYDPTCGSGRKRRKASD